MVFVTYPDSHQYLPAQKQIEIQLLEREYNYYSLYNKIAV